jgi:CRISPR-associated protein Cas1
MQTLYVSRQGCQVALAGETLTVQSGAETIASVRLPLLEMVLVFGQSQVTTQAIRACLQRDIPIVYLSRLGYCYGRVLPIARGYRQLSRYQQQLSFVERMITARAIVAAKVRNSRVLLQRQARRGSRSDDDEARLRSAIADLEVLAERAMRSEDLDRLRGLEGAAASCYFSAFGLCFDRGSGLQFAGRSRRPPGNPVNAMLSFGYQVLWNHLLSLIELQGLDPYSACLHEGSSGHAALASDLVEPFRSSIVDSLTLYLANRGLIQAADHFEWRDGGCFLNEAGRRVFLGAFVQRMEEGVGSDDGDSVPRWELLHSQVRAYKRFVYNPIDGFSPYRLR